MFKSFVDFVDTISKYRGVELDKEELKTLTAPFYESIEALEKEIESKA